MSTTKPSQLISAISSFSKGDIAATGESLMMSERNSLGLGDNDVFRTLLDGNVSEADAVSICTTLGNKIVEVMFPGNPLMQFVGPVIGTVVGTGLARAIPTDIKLFPSPLKEAAPTDNDAYSEVLKEMSSQMSDMSSKMNLSNLSDTVLENTDTLNSSENGDDDDVDSRIEMVISLVDDPVGFFRKSFPQAAMLLEAKDPGSAIMALAKMNASDNVSKTRGILKKKMMNSMGENRTQAARNAGVRTSGLNSMNSAVDKAIPALNSYYEKKATEAVSEEDRAYYTLIKSEVNNGKLYTAASGSIGGQKEIAGLVKSQRSAENAYDGLMNAWAERQQNTMLDSARNEHEAMLEAKYGIAPRESATRRFLTTNVKFVAKAVKILNKAKQDMSPTMKSAEKMLKGSSGIGDADSLVKQAIPDARPEDVELITKTITNQLPPERQMERDSGVDNLSFTGGQILSQMNSLSEKLGTGN